MITFSKLGRYGQLGNQLFQYSLLLGVSAKTGFQIRIPQKYRAAKKQGLVEFAPLNVSALPLRPCDKTEIKHTFLYDDLAFNPAVFEQPDGTDFCGYYQTEKYFKHVEADIRREFTFEPKIASYAKQTANSYRLLGERLIAIHVRRGDYLQHPNNFRTLTPEYIAKALNLPEVGLGGSTGTCLVFSDDLPWCHEHIQGNIQLVHSPTHWHDMALMAECDAHIISASSFGWWGAWLSTRPNKVVVAPKPWFPAGITINTQDVVPEDWIQLED